MPATSIGYDVLNCYTVDPEDLNDGSGRADKCEVVFSHGIARWHNSHPQNLAKTFFISFSI